MLPVIVRLMSSYVLMNLSTYWKHLFSVSSVTFLQFIVRLTVFCLMQSDVEPSLQLDFNIKDILIVMVYLA